MLCSFVHSVVLISFVLLDGSRVVTCWARLIDNLKTDSFMYYRMSLEEVSIIEEIWWEFLSVGNRILALRLRPRPGLLKSAVSIPSGIIAVFIVFN